MEPIRLTERAELAQHLMMRLADSRVIASSPDRLRQAAISFLTVGRGFPLLSFRVVNTHIHALVLGDHATGGEFARRVEISMQKRLHPEVRFSEVHREPVRDQRHLVSTFWYVLRNAERHRCAVDPLFEASNLPDLLGMRTLGAWTREHAWGAYPRLQVAELRELLPVQPGTVPNHLQCLLDATEAAVGLPPGRLRGQAPSKPQRGEGRQALIAAAHLAGGSQQQVADTLQIGRRTVQRMLTTEPREDLTVAVERQLAVRCAWSALQGARGAV